MFEYRLGYSMIYMLIIQLGEDGEIYVVLRPIVEALGLSCGSQLNRIKRDAVLSKKMRNYSTFA